jgi:hypothetical protein
VSEAKWEEERETLLEGLRKAQQIAAESQAEAAVYRDMLEDWREAATQALAQKDLSFLYKINDNRSVPFFLSSKEEGERWGRLFLSAYMRDAGWLKHTKKALDKIKAEAENMVEDNETNTELKKRIIAIAEDGLITHI